MDTDIDIYLLIYTSTPAHPYNYMQIQVHALASGHTSTLSLRPLKFPSLQPTSWAALP